MLSLIIDGHEFSLDDGVYSTLVGYDGWGASPTARVSSSGPLQHGETDEGQFLEARVGNLILQNPKTALDNLYDARMALLDLINPADNLILKWSLPYGVRYFDVVFYGDMTMEWEVKQWANLKFSLTFKAPNPTCYDPETFVLSFVGSSGTAFVVPMVVNVFVGGSTLISTQSIQYKGNWDESPIVEIRGPAEDPVIENLTTGEKLDFTGLTLGSGALRTIDTRYGFKTVVDGSGVNKIAELTNDSDLATFHLARKRPYEPYRNNIISVNATGIDSTTRILVRWNERYLGI